jgi:hypothetical protein
MLNERLEGYLCYFERLALQPQNHWEGFYITPLEDAHFGLRFQLAFPCYALAAICLHPNADDKTQDRCREAMSALIDRMLQRRVWAYQAVRAEQAGTSPDPVAEGNAQYSGHLAMMLGVYRAAGGDARYNEPFSFRWSPDNYFTYTHTTLVEVLWQQMTSSEHGGIECIPGQVSTTAMVHVLWALALHDATHGSTFAEANAAWLAFMRQRLIRRGPRLPGQRVFRPYTLRRGLGLAPRGKHFVDAWILALLACLDPETTSELAPRFLRAIRYVSSTIKEGNPQAYVPSARMWSSREVADEATATGFGYVLASERDDESLAAALRAYANQQLDPVNEEGTYFYRGGVAAPYTTALFALGEAGGLRKLAALLPRSTLKTTAPDPAEADDPSEPTDDEESMQSSEAGFLEPPDDEEQARGA